jgi:D-aminoacyl-tRNA deacylase
VRAVVQRVSQASVTVDHAVVGQIGEGFLVLLGVGPTDGEPEVQWLAEKLAGLRVFADAEGKMNLSLVDRGLGALVISQFTLYADVRKGKRPSFVGAAHPSLAEPLYARFCDVLQSKGVPVQRGIFAADMKVALVNDGPVTVIIDTPNAGVAGLAPPVA